MVIMKDTDLNQAGFLGKSPLPLTCQLAPLINYTLWSLISLAVNGDSEV